MKDELLRAAELANDDGEFAVAARMWNADLAFVSGSEAVQLAVREGVLRVGSPAGAGAGIRVVGPADGWEKLLQAVPPPFYQDLFGAMMHHGFRVEGDVESMYPYYPALRRLLELMRHTSTEAA